MARARACAPPPGVALRAKRYSRAVTETRELHTGPIVPGASPSLRPTLPRIGHRGGSLQPLPPAPSPPPVSFGRASRTARVKPGLFESHSLPLVVSRLLDDSVATRLAISILYSPPERRT